MLGKGAPHCGSGGRAAEQQVSRLCTFAGAFPSAKGEGFEQQGADWPEQRRGFRGNAENAKTKLCMRCAHAISRHSIQCEGLVFISSTRPVRAGGKMAIVVLETGATLRTEKRSCVASHREGMAMVRVPDLSVVGTSEVLALKAQGKPRWYETI